MRNKNTFIDYKKIYLNKEQLNKESFIYFFNFNIDSNINNYRFNIYKIN